MRGWLSAVGPCRGGVRPPGRTLFLGRAAHPFSWRTICSRRLGASQRWSSSRHLGTCEWAACPITYKSLALLLPLQAAHLPGADLGDWAAGGGGGGREPSLQVWWVGWSRRCVWLWRVAVTAPERQEEALSSVCLFGVLDKNGFLVACRPFLDEVRVWRLPAASHGGHDLTVLSPLPAAAATCNWQCTLATARAAWAAAKHRRI